MGFALSAAVWPSAPRAETMVNAKDSAQYCTADKNLCFQVVVSDSGNGQELIVQDRKDSCGNDTNYNGRIKIPNDDQTSQTLHPYIVRLPNYDENMECIYTALVGIISHTKNETDGQSLHGQRLRLYRITFGWENPRFHTDHELLGLPWTSAERWGNCASQDHRKARLGVCNDKFEFDASLQINKTMGGGLPDFLFQTRATTFPKGASHWLGKSPPVKQSDLKTWTDPLCTYSRTLRYNPITARYEMDMPAPDCSEYYWSL